jgi:hypothetical protein
VDSRRRVHFSEEGPQVHHAPPPQYDDQDYMGSYDPYASKGGYQHQEYDSYIPPAGRNYMNPNIEKDQVERKFNRTNTEKLNPKETFKELFAHPESEGPLDGGNDPRKQQVPVEYDIRKTDQKINDTAVELKK